MKNILVDAGDQWIVDSFNWHLLKGKSTCYARAHIPGTGCTTTTGKRVLLHHLIVGKPLPGYDVDHVNRNGLDCTRSNLRVVPKFVNSHNQKLRKTNSTGFTGVSPHGKKFRARIRVNGKLTCLGIHNTPEQASMAYNRAKEDGLREYILHS